MPDKPMICPECAESFKAHFETAPLETSSEWRAKFLKGEFIFCDLCQVPQSVWKQEMHGWPEGKSRPEVLAGITEEKRGEIRKWMENVKAVEKKIKKERVGKIG